MKRGSLHRAMRGWSHDSSTFAAIALTIATGLGSAAAAWTLVERALLQGPPYPDAERLVRIESVEPLRGSTSDNAARDVIDYGAAATRLRDVTTFLVSDYNLRVDGRAVPLTLTFASSELWSLTGVLPAIGRLYGSDNDRPGGDIRKVVLSDALWTHHFGGNPDVVGASIVLGTASYEVIGVMPRGFAFPERSQAWVPLEAWFNYLGTTRETVVRGGRSYGGAGRLVDRATIAEAQNEAEAISSRLATEHPSTNSGVRLRLAPFSTRLAAASRPFLLLGLGAAATLLLTSVAAAAAMFTARRLARRPTVEIQLALGATPRHLLELALSEALPLAAASGLFAVALGSTLIGLVQRLVPEPRPVWLETGVSPSAAGFSLATAALLAAAGCLFANLRRRGDVPLTVRSVSRSSSMRARRALTATQVTFAIALLLGAVTTARDLRRLLRVETGFDATGVVGVYVSPPGDDFEPRERGAQYAAFYDRTIEALRQAPGVRAAAGINVLPLRSRSGFQRNTITAAGQDAQAQEDNPVVNVLRTSDGYFDVMGIPLLEGRDFDARDTRTAERVAVVSERLARRLWPGASPIGRQLKLGTPRSPSPWATIIGVVGDVRSSAVHEENDFDLYFSYRQVIAGELHFVIRGDRPRADTVAVSMEVVRRANPGAAIFRTLALEELVMESLWQQRLWTAALIVFALSACAVAATSVYAVVMAFATMRQREFAIRAALGAARIDLLRIVGSESLRIICAGAIAGGAVGAVAVRLASATVVGLSGPTPSILAAALGLAILVFGLAALPPMRHAARTDPASTLRSE